VAQLVAMPGHEPVEPLDRPGGVPGCTRQARVAERLEQFDSGHAAGRCPTVPMNEVPGRKLLRLGQRLEQRLGGRILERQQRDATAPIEPSDGTRREPAQPSTAVVQQHRSSGLHSTSP